MLVLFQSIIVGLQAAITYNEPTPMTVGILALVICCWIITFVNEMRIRR